MLCVGIRRETNQQGDGPALGHDDGILATWRLLRRLGMHEVDDLRSRRTRKEAGMTPQGGAHTHFALARPGGKMEIEMAGQATVIVPYPTQRTGWATLQEGHCLLPGGILLLIACMLGSHDGDVHDQLRTWRDGDLVVPGGTSLRRCGWKGMTNIRDLTVGPLPVDMWSNTLHWGWCNMRSKRTCVCCRALQVLASPTLRRGCLLAPPTHTCHGGTVTMGCDACISAGMLAATCRTMCEATRAARWGNWREG